MHLYDSRLAYNSGRRFGLYESALRITKKNKKDTICRKKKKMQHCRINAFPWRFSSMKLAQTTTRRDVDVTPTGNDIKVSSNSCKIRGRKPRHWHTGDLYINLYINIPVIELYQRVLIKKREKIKRNKTFVQVRKVRQAKRRLVSRRTASWRWASRWCSAVVCGCPSVCINACKRDALKTPLRSRCNAWRLFWNTHRL